MANRQQINLGNNGGSTNTIVAVLVLVGLLLGIYYISKAIFTILYWVSPVLLLLTLIIDYKVVLNFGQWVVSMLKRNPAVGVIAIIFTLIAYPVVIAFLFGRALFNRQVKQVKQQYQAQKEGELVDFEELESKPIDLPELEKRKQGNEYDDTFE